MVFRVTRNTYTYVGNDPLNFIDPLGLAGSGNARPLPVRPPRPPLDPSLNGRNKDLLDNTAELTEQVNEYKEKIGPIPIIRICMKTVCLDPRQPPQLPTLPGVCPLYPEHEGPFLTNIGGEGLIGCRCEKWKIIVIN